MCFLVRVLQIISVLISVLKETYLNRYKTLIAAYGMYYLGQKKGVELGVTAGALNALGSTVDNAGNKIIQVKSKHAAKK